MKRMVVLGIALLALCGCNLISINSLTKNFPVEVDGKDHDWDDAKIFLKEKGMVVGLANDEEFLYFCFYPTDKMMTKNILKNGINIWVSTDGKKSRDYGFAYPRPSEGKSTRSGDRKNESRQPGISNLVKKIKESNNSVLFYDNGRERVVPQASLQEIQLCFDAENEVFAYEGKIPLKSISADFSLDAEPGDEIIIGLTSKGDEVEAPAREEDDSFGSSSGRGRQGGGGKGSGGSRGSGGGKGGSRGGGDKGASRSTTSQNLDLWVNLTLAQ